MLKPGIEPKSLVLSMILLLGASYPSALGQANTFTYQGQLKQQGAPLTQLVDMRYLLFDSETAESPIAGPLVFDGQDFNLPAIQVDQGLFTVELAFEEDALQLGQWLEVQVRSPHDPSDGGAYISLTPRQHITAAPFALSVPGLAMNDEGVEIEGDVHALGQVAASAYTSNSPLIFKVNPLDMECARFEDQHCYLGLGTDNPQARLHIGGVAGIDGVMFPDGSIQTTAAGLGGGDGYWSPSGANVYNNNGGSVGIGTTAPLAKLDVAASGEGAELLRFTTERPWVFRQIYTGPSTGLQLQSTVGLKNFEITGSLGRNVATFLTDNDNPRVGIGTTAPLSRLDIAASGEGTELLRFSTERPWVFRQIYSGPSAGLQLYSTVGLKNFEITAANGTNVATFLTDTVNPRVGINNTAPISRLDIVGQDGLGITGFQPFMTLRDSNAANARARIQNVGGSMYFYPESSFATGNAPLSVLNSGRVRVNILEIAGADVAEKFLSDDKNVEPGTVMEIDAENTGKLRVARDAYSPRVAGVVSGAGDIPVGAVLGNLPGHDDAPAIALSGRVWVRCEASSAAIEAGNLLTTSSSPGLAMKASDRERSTGAVLGKAMTGLAQGERGLVLVLVNLQ